MREECGSKSLGEPFRDTPKTVTAEETTFLSAMRWHSSSLRDTTMARCSNTEYQAKYDLLARHVIFLWRGKVTWRAPSKKLSATRLAKTCFTQVATASLIICFPVGWPPGHPPGNCFSWQTKTIQSPWVEGIKLMTNSPSLWESMNSQKIISFTNCQE